MILATWITATLDNVPELQHKVYPTLGPVDAEAPYAVYGIISARGVTAHTAPADESLDEGTFQISVYAGGYAEAWRLAQLARAALEEAVPEGKLGFQSVALNDLGREVDTRLYHVAVRVNYQFSYMEV